MATPTEIGKPLKFTPSEADGLSPSEKRDYDFRQTVILFHFNAHWTAQQVSMEEWHELQLQKLKNMEEKLAKDVAKIEESLTNAKDGTEKLKLDKEKTKADKQKIKIEKSRQEIQSKFEKSMTELRNKRAKEWGRVLKQLLNLKGILLRNKKAVDALQNLFDTDGHIPQQGRWIAFPLGSIEESAPKGEVVSKSRDITVDITWLQHNMTNTATYYKTTCWFGKLTVEDEDEGSDSDGTITPNVVLEPFGETELFIAAEFIERRYQGAPHLRNYHLRDKFSPETKWAYMRIGAPLYYGQDAENPKHRYLVYHPFIRTRDIPQRAFADNLNLSKAKSLLDLVGSSSNSQLAATGVTASALLTVLSSFLADPLRPFKSEEGEDIYTHEAEIAKRRAEREMDHRFQTVLELSRMTTLVNDLAQKYTESDQDQSPEQDNIVIAESKNTLNDLRAHIEKRKNRRLLIREPIKIDRKPRKIPTTIADSGLKTRTLTESSLQKITTAQAEAQNQLTSSRPADYEEEA
ncbi:hypothetical protein V8C35DRAFT_306787 [Trichoderma chlorosporum]